MQQMQQMSVLVLWVGLVRADFEVVLPLETTDVDYQWQARSVVTRLETLGTVV